MGGPIKISIYAGGHFFFFAGATAPPMGNVAPPLVREIAKWKNKKLWEDRKVR